MKVPYLLVDAFTETPGTGNRVALVLDARGFDEATLLRVARKLRVREVAFVTGWQGDAFDVRFFTPEKEIEFTGAAAIALGLMLVRQGQAKSGTEKLFLRTPVDTVPVEIHYRDEGPFEAVIREPAPASAIPPPTPFSARPWPSSAVTSAICTGVFPSVWRSPGSGRSSFRWWHRE